MTREWAETDAGGLGEAVSRRLHAAARMLGEACLLLQQTPPASIERRREFAHLLRTVADIVHYTFEELESGESAGSRPDA